MRPGSRDPVHQDPGPETSSKFKSGTRDLLKFKSGTPVPSSKFKNGTPHFYLMNSIFWEHFIFVYLFFFFFFFVFFKWDTKNYQLWAGLWELSTGFKSIKKVYVTTKYLFEETEQKIVRPNLIEVVTFLDLHRLVILLKVYLWQFCMLIFLRRFHLG